MKKYDQYKDSGVEWLGEIPEHWKILPGLSFIYENKDRNKGMIRNTVLSLSYGKIRVKEENELTGLVPESFETYQFVNKGDLIFRPTDLQNDTVSLRSSISEYEGIITNAYLNLRFKSKADSKFYHYFFRSIDNNKIIYGLGSGLRQNISYLDFRRFQFPFPPKGEQTTIANFLDDKTTKIDQAIAIKQKQIELLKERRQILIHKAVTRGLNDDVKLKDSGVEWIGKIPEHWEVLPITKYSTRIDYRGKTPEKVEDGIFLITTKNIKEGKIDYENSKEYVLEKHYNSIMSRGVPAIGDILFTMEAPLGMSAVVNRTDVAIAQRIIKFNFCNIKFNSTFVNYSIQSEYFQTHLKKEATGSTAQGIKASKLHKLKIITPKIEEQQEIVDFIETSTTKIDTAISLKEQEIDKLKEYKMSLIDGVVTGKVKVC